MALARRLDSRLCGQGGKERGPLSPSFPRRRESRNPRRLAVGEGYRPSQRPVGSRLRGQGGNPRAPLCGVLSQRERGDGALRRLDSRLRGNDEDPRGRWRRGRRGLGSLGARTQKSARDRAARYEPRLAARFQRFGGETPTSATAQSFRWARDAPSAPKPRATHPGAATPIRRRARAPAPEGRPSRKARPRISTNASSFPYKA